MTKIDVSEVDGDLLGVAAGLGPQLVHIAGHPLNILSPSVWMVNGGWPTPFKRGAHAGKVPFS
jgi:hypothetical protein